MKKILLLISLSFSLLGKAQKQGQALIDSLIKEIPAAKDDTAAVRLHKLIADRYTYTDPVKAREYADKGMLLAGKMKWTKGIAVFNSIIATLFSDAGNYDSAIFYNKNALAIHKKNEDKYNVASILNNLGVVYQRQSKYTEATRCFFESLKTGEELKNNNLIALGYDNISSVYSSQGNYAKALDYSFKALKIREEENNAEGIASVLNNIAGIYLEVPDSAKAAEYYRKSLPLFEQVENKVGIATVYSNLSVLQNHDYKNKLLFALKAQAIWDEVAPSNLLSIINTGNIGVAYLDIAKNYPGGYPNPDENIPPAKNAQLQKAVSWFEKAISLSKEINDINNEAYFTGNLAEAQEQLGDYRNAYINFRRYQQVQDSIYSQENKNKIAAIEGQREVSIRDKEIAFNKVALANQRKLRWALIGGIGLLLIIAGLLYLQSRTRKKMNTTLMVLNNQLDEANKVKAKFFAILSHDLRSPVANLINFLHLQKNEPGLLTTEQAAVHEKKISNSAESLLETMEAMLLWSKGQMENFKPQIKLVAVDDLFSYIQKFFAGTDNIDFKFSNSSRLSVATDENYLQTIMQNLTANAVKALQKMPSGAIEWKARSEGGKIVLSITDNGPGVNEEQVKALYDDSTTVNTKNGLGLHIIKDLAKAIQCKISMQSQKGMGTTFTLIAG